jgi:HlyD family secretion protein
MKKALKVIIIIVIILAVLGGGLALFGRSLMEKQKQNIKDSAEKYTVTKGDLSLSAVGSGKIVSSDIKKVVVSGNVTEIIVSVGDYVKKDAVLAKYKDAAGTEKDFKAEYEGVITAVPNSTNDTSSAVSSAIGGAKSSLTAATSSSTFEISSNQKLQMDIDATENDIYKIKVGQKASVYIVALDLAVDGKVARVSQTGNTSGDFSIYSVTISFDKGKNDIYLGMTGSAKIIVSTKTNAIKVPVDALIEKENKRYVLLSSWFDNMNKQKEDYYVEVKTGISDSDFVEITSGDIAGKEILILTDTSTSNFMMPPRDNNSDSTGA